MEVIDKALPATKRPSQPTLHRLSVDDYLRMRESGLFGPEPHVELVNGEVVDMATIGTRHASTVTRLNRALMSAVGPVAIVTARHGVVEVWVVDLEARSLSLCRGPQDETYADVTRTEHPRRRSRACPAW